MGPTIPSPLYKNIASSTPPFENGDTAWADAVHLEISTLIRMNCFDFKSPDYKPDKDYQFAPLRMIFEAKQDGRKKARFVAQGHVLDKSGISTRSTVVKSISSRLIDLIAHCGSRNWLVRQHEIRQGHGH